MKFENNYNFVASTLNESSYAKADAFAYPVKDYLSSEYSKDNLLSIGRDINVHFNGKSDGKYMVVIAPCGTGKTYAITRELIPSLDDGIIPILAVPNRVQISQLKQEIGDIPGYRFYNGDSNTKISLSSEAAPMTNEQIMDLYMDAYNAASADEKETIRLEDFIAKNGSSTYDTIISVYDKCNEIIEVADTSDYSRMLLIIDEAHEMLQSRDYRRSAIDSLGFLSYNIVQNGGMVIYMTGTPSCLVGGAPYSFGENNQYSKIWEFIPVENELNGENCGQLTDDNISDYVLRDKLNAEETIIIRQQDDDPMQSIENSYNKLNLSRKDEISVNLATEVIKQIRSGNKPFIRFNNIKLTKDIINVIRRMGYNAISVDSSQKTSTIEENSYDNVIYDNVIRHSALPFYDKKGAEIHAYFSTSLLDTGTNINGIEKNGEFVPLSYAEKIVPIYVTARKEDFSIDNMTQFFSRLRFMHKMNIIYIFGENTEFETRYRKLEDIIRSNKSMGERFITGMKRLSAPDDEVRSTHIGLHRQADIPPYVIQVGNVDRSTKRVIDNALLYYDAYLKYQRQYFYGSKKELELFLNKEFNHIRVEDRRIDMDIIEEYQETKEQMQADVTEICNQQMDAFFAPSNEESKQNDRFIRLMNGKLEEDKNFMKTLTDVDSKFADPIKFATRSIIAFNPKDEEKQKDEIENLKYFISLGQRVCSEHITQYHGARVMDLIIQAYHEDDGIKEMLFDLAKKQRLTQLREDGTIWVKRKLKEKIIEALVNRQVKSFMSKENKGTFVETSNDRELWSNMFSSVMDNPTFGAALQLINVAVYSAYPAEDDRVDIPFALELVKQTNKEKLYRLVHAYEMISYTADEKMVLADCTVSGFEYAFLTSKRAFNIAGFNCQGDFGLGRWIDKKITPDIADRLADALTQEVKKANIMKKQKYFRRDIYAFFASTFKCERSGMQYGEQRQSATVLRITGVWRFKNEIRRCDANMILNVSARTPRNITEEGAREMYGSNGANIERLRLPNPT